MTYFFIGSAIMFVLLVTIQYNSIITKRNQINNALSSLDALFIKRNDLIPNLVSLVKQYMNFETSTLEKITQLRSNQPEYKADNEASQQINKVLLQVEAYPELKTDTQFTNLQRSWNEAEEQIAAGRRFLSTSITAYNNTIMAFPNNVIAGMMGAKPYQWQEATLQQTQVPNAENLFQ